LFSALGVESIQPAVEVSASSSSHTILYHTGLPSKRSTGSAQVAITRERAQGTEQPSILYIETYLEGLRCWCFLWQSSPAYAKLVRQATTHCTVHTDSDDLNRIILHSQGPLIHSSHTSSPTPASSSPSPSPQLSYQSQSALLSAPVLPTGNLRRIFPSQDQTRHPASYPERQQRPPLLDRSNLLHLFHHRRTTPYPPISSPPHDPVPQSALIVSPSRPLQAERNRYSPRPYSRPPYLRLPQHIVDFSKLRLFGILDCSPLLLAHPR
jgi:hypothetical protein